MRQENRSAWNIDIGVPRPATSARFSMGTAHAPGGAEITASRDSLWRDGTPWLPVMGEFHYARYPEEEWREELLKMRAGGIDIVASYVFWIHHEEVQGRWDWSGRRDLRAFVGLCAEVGLLVCIRVGPWAHGEVRNGGFPDWLLPACTAVREDVPDYLHYTALLYRQIAGRLDGFLWKDGGPVVSVQCENEYGGPAEHLLTLKRLATEAGLDVPLYTRTGWPDLATPMPPGELLPLFGGYPDGFWDRSLQEMPPGYRGAFLFTPVRADAAIATDLLGDREVFEDRENALYPYFACEIGGGMERSYHRRIRIAPMDIAALALVKLGCGNNLQGYYMYHGGTNPDGVSSTLQESQATGYWNDVPVKSYDFQAPLGEFGQVREHYHRLRLLHLFLRDFGATLARMPATIPLDRPASASDTDTVRWAVRSDGWSGFVFVNNYQRMQPMPAKENAQFHLCLPEGCVLLPASPVTVPADSTTIWPFRLDLGGLELTYATAQLVCRIKVGQDGYHVFSETTGVPAEFGFAGLGWTVEETTGNVLEEGDGLRVTDVRPGIGVAIMLRHESGERRHILLLDEAQSLACWKETLAGRERLLLTRASLTADGDTLRLVAPDAADLTVGIFPAPSSVWGNGRRISGCADGVFQRFAASATSDAADFHVVCEQVQSPGPLRRISPGAQGVAEAPTEADFDAAAVWRIRLPAGAALRGLLRIRYVGDVARLYAGDRLLTDNFYNGTPFEVGLDRYAPDLAGQDMLLKILPLQRQAPIYLPGDAWPEWGDADSVAALQGVDIVEDWHAVLRVEDRW